MRAPVDVRADVAFACERRNTRMQADAYLHRARGKCAFSPPGCSCGSRRGREGDEERVALRIDLDAPFSRERLP